MAESIESKFCFGRILKYWISSRFHPRLLPCTPRPWIRLQCNYNSRKLLLPSRLPVVILLSLISPSLILYCPPSLSEVIHLSTHRTRALDPTFITVCVFVVLFFSWFKVVEHFSAKLFEYLYYLFPTSFLSSIFLIPGCCNFYFHFCYFYLLLPPCSCHFSKVRRRLEADTNVDGLLTPFLFLTLLNWFLCWQKRLYNDKTSHPWFSIPTGSNTAISLLYRQPAHRHIWTTRRGGCR